MRNNGSKAAADMSRKKVWNKGKIVGTKPALTPENVQAIRLILAQTGTARDRALFSTAIDSSLRSIDLLKLRVMDVIQGGQVKEAVRVQPSKTKGSSGLVVTFDLQRDTRKLLEHLIEAEDLMSTDFLFQPTAGRSRSRGGALSRRAYADLVKKWVKSIGLPPEAYGTHSLRRARPAYLYRKTGQLRACQIMLGHSTITNTQRYLGIEEAETLELARQWAL